MDDKFRELKQKIANPALVAEKAPYLIKFAETEEEVREVQRLRFRVFNEEQGKGLDSSNQDGIDRDEFDDVSLHLVVRHQEAGAIGTYRVIIGHDNSSVESMYSYREFDIRGMENLRASTIEVGRSCVAAGYRNGAVVALLWAGISNLITRSGMRYIAGCPSLEETNPAAGWALYEDFKRRDMLTKKISAEPRPGFLLPRPPQEEIDAILNDPARMRELCPPLLKGYIRMGCRLCGPPAFDYEFKTIDFLAILDVANLPERYNRHFNVHVQEQG